MRNTDPDADVLAVRGFLGFEYTDDNTASRADIEEALARDRNNVHLTQISELRGLARSGRRVRSGSPVAIETGVSRAVS